MTTKNEALEALEALGAYRLDDSGSGRVNKTPEWSETRHHIEAQAAEIERLEVEKRAAVEKIEEAHAQHYFQNLSDIRSAFDPLLDAANQVVRSANAHGRESYDIARISMDSLIRLERALAILQGDNGRE